MDYEITGDCPVRALMALTGMSYKDAQAMAEDRGYRGDGLSRIETILLMLDAGFDYKVIHVDKYKGKTVEDSVRRLRLRRGIVFSKDHVMAVKGGVLDNAGPCARHEAKVIVQLIKRRRKAA